MKNLHVALIMDCSNAEFTVRCESNPALYKQCYVLWKEAWSPESMVQVCNKSTLEGSLNFKKPGNNNFVVLDITKAGLIGLCFVSFKLN